MTDEEKAAAKAEKAEKKAEKAEKKKAEKAAKAEKKKVEKAEKKKADAAKAEKKKAEKKRKTDAAKAEKKDGKPGTQHPVKLSLSWRAFEDHIEALVLDAANRALTGAKKRKLVVTGIAKFLRKHIHIGDDFVSNAAEKLLSKLIAETLNQIWVALAQHVYERLRDSDKLPA